MGKAEELFLKMSDEEILNPTAEEEKIEEKQNDQTPLDDLAVIYIHHVGKNSEGLNIYHFLLSDNPEDVSAEGWYEVPACNEPKNLMQPDDEFVTAIKEWKTSVKLDLAQDNCCFSFQDCKDHIFALGHENISEYEEYPDPIRLMFFYGESISDIESDLATRNEITRWLPKQYAKIDEK